WHLTVLCLCSFAAEHGWDTPSTCCGKKMFLKYSDGEGPRIALRQARVKVHHKRRRDHRREQVHERHGKQPSDHDTPGEDTPAEPMPYCRGRCQVKPTQSYHLEILSPQKISVQAQEDKKIHAGQKHVKRQCQDV